MQNILIFLSIYITGYVIAYLVIKKDFVDDFGRENWTQGDRAFALIVSTSSWLGAVGGIISHIIKEFNSNKRANW
ncbi:MAG TPA: hypothetical protein PLR63_08765 [Paludibacteraceae bacterium]|nr:hypothetical protein [Paludibacteraceae bacterium]